MRIVSLVPSLTAALIDLGVGSSVVGRTVYCPAAPGAAVVGGTRNPDVPAILDLRPDVVLAVKEENPREPVVELRKGGFPVEVYDPLTVADAVDLARDLGRLAGTDQAGEEMATEIEEAVGLARQSAADRPPIETVYLIWRDPYMAAGPRTFIADVLRTCGLTDVFPPEGDRYPALGQDALRTLPARLFLFSNEPFPFQSKHLEEFRAAARLPASGAPAKRLCRGDLVGWYPSRTAAALHHLTLIAQEVAGSESEER